MLTSQAAFEGERKHVTVLFADLKDSTELIAGRDAEEARAILDPVLTLMMEAVHEYDGLVYQVMGDGIMALFGAPIAHEDHPVRACYAALRMHELVSRRAREHPEWSGVPAAIRVGLNTGEVVVRSIGTDLEVDYTAVGQTTHLAARMEQLAPSGGTLITTTTAHRAAGYILTGSPRQVEVKGLAEPMEVMALLGRTDVTSRFRITAARGLARLVGREHELGQFERAFAQAASGQGQVLALVGDPGVGKSRLLHEFQQAAQDRGWQVLAAYAMPWRRSAPYLPLATLVRSELGVLPEDDGEHVAARLGGTLTGAEHRRLFPALLALLDLSAMDPTWNRLDPGQRQRLILEALRHLFINRARPSPLCLVVEDLHWADPETLAALDSLVEAVATARRLLLVSYRPEHHHEWGNKSYYHQVRVDPLSAEGAADLTSELIGSDPTLATLRTELVERTGGNPLFLEECIHALVEERHLRGGVGHRHLATGPAARLEFPASVQDVIAARVDRLSLEDKRILQTAAIIGKDVSARLLRSVLESPDDALRAALSRLQSREFLYEVSLVPEPRFTFRHGLLQEVVLGGVLRPRRQSVDARIVQILEQEPDGQRMAHLDQLVYHALRGELWAQAATHAREAGRRAFERSAHRVAMTHFESALGALARLRDSPENRGAAVDLHLEFRNVLAPLGEAQKLLTTLSQAERLASTLDDPRRQGLVAAFQVNYFTVRGDLSEAIAHGERALALARDTNDLHIGVLANTFLSLTRYGRGEYGQAVALAGRSMDILNTANMFERFGMAFLPAVYARTIMVWSLAELGNFAGAASVAKEGLDIAERSEHPHSLAFACVGMGGLHLRQGNLDGARAFLERARSVAREADLPAVLVEAAAALTSTYAQAGLGREAKDLVTEATELAIAHRLRIGHFLRTGSRAEAYLAGGNFAEALPLAELYLQMTMAIGARGLYAWGLLVVAEAAAALNDDTRAQAALAEASALADELSERQ